MSSRAEVRERRLENMRNELQIVNQGLMYAELNEFFAKHLINDGYAGIEYKPYNSPIEITVKVAKTDKLLEENKLRIKQMIAMIQMRFMLPEGSVAIFVDQVKNKGLNAQIQADMIREKLSTAIPVRRAVTAALRIIMESGAAGAQVIISGKIKGQRAKSYKVTTGTVMHSGNPTKDYVKKAQAVVLLKQGVLGIKVAITLKYDPTGKNGTSVLHPNNVKIYSQEELNEMQKAKEKPARMYASRERKEGEKKQSEKANE